MSKYSSQTFPLDHYVEVLRTTHRLQPSIVKSQLASRIAWLWHKINRVSKTNPKSPVLGPVFDELRALVQVAEIYEKVVPSMEADVPTKVKRSLIKVVQRDENKTDAHE